VELDDMGGKFLVMEVVGPIEEDEDQVKAGEEGPTHLEVFRDSLATVVMATYRVGGRDDGAPAVVVGVIVVVVDGDVSVVGRSIHQVLATAVAAAAAVVVVVGW